VNIVLFVLGRNAALHTRFLAGIQLEVDDHQRIAKGMVAAGKRVFNAKTPRKGI